MGWKETLEKLRLVDIQGSINLKQGGLVNITVENNNYYLTIPNTDPELIKKFRLIKLTPEMEIDIKNKVKQKLENVKEPLDVVSEETRREMLAASSTTASLDFIKKL